MNKGMFSSNTPEWATPNYLYEEIVRKYGYLTLDVCATPENTKCHTFFTKGIDGLKQDWAPYTCWMNPPYGKEIKLWVEKAYRESREGAYVVCLLPARTDTKWFHEFCLKGKIKFLKGRVKFGDSKNSAPFPSMIVVFGSRKKDFEK